MLIKGTGKVVGWAVSTVDELTSGDLRAGMALQEYYHNQALENDTTVDPFADEDASTSRSTSFSEEESTTVEDDYGPEWSQSRRYSDSMVEADIDYGAQVEAEISGAEAVTVAESRPRPVYQRSKVP